jgi:arylsulfatase A-like enzyme
MKIQLRYLLPLLAIWVSCKESDKKQEKAKLVQERPNIVYILADDMGYGDLSINNPESKIETHNLDKLAAQSMRFTDAHAPSSVCTPSRYGILTGNYCWRSRLPQSVLQGYGRALIEPDQLTVAAFLKNAGYYTGVVGKWHLGLDWVVKPGHEDALKIPENDPDGARIIKNLDPAVIDFGKPVSDGPREHGFTYSYILPASLDMEPYCYLQNDTLTAPLDSFTKGSELNPKGSPNYATGAFWRPGLMSANFDFNDVLPHCTKKAIEYIQNHSASDKPYFLYFAMPAPHTPWLPSPAFRGKSKAGLYGDYVTMVDDAVGQVLKAIEASGKADNTIVIFTSDNGPYWRPAYIEKYRHHAAYVFRGMKADAWEGGHRVPFMVRWPGQIKPGTISNYSTTLTNLMATCADILGMDTKIDKAPDSYSILPVLKGEGKAEAPPIVNESSHGLFAVRRGEWKLIEGRGSGGFSDPVFYSPGPGEPKGQLYNLLVDSSEKDNRYLYESERVNQMHLLLDSIRQLKQP